MPSRSRPDRRLTGLRTASTARPESRKALTQRSRRLAGIQAGKRPLTEAAGLAQTMHLRHSPGRRRLRIDPASRLQILIAVDAEAAAQLITVSIHQSQQML
ncbi:hypothetical protein [Streptomyces sp. NPDC058145]|uniref:hypothetical protein n=1 Tax=Streptomyces sp. NPDC058145 TaxID=3346356 RepID=UPI0036E24140